jgi:hypothetical protein
VKIVRVSSGLQELEVECEGGLWKAINYPELLGEVVPGDRVKLNTTAVKLSLGSGGAHFVMDILGRDVMGGQMGPGHIMKLRYTPLQTKVLSVEEEDSPFHEEMRAAESVAGMVVLAGTLHSQLAPLVCCLAARGVKPVYIMTDGAALPMAFSRTVASLVERRMLAGTITVGHAFGGGLEAVNIYSGLIAARHALKADVAIVTMGPGIVGTGTRWGFSGIEQGQVVNAAAALGGIPIVVPRISFADARERHNGLSHHTLTVLSRVCLTPAVVALPEMAPDKMEWVQEQVFASGLERLHQTLWLPGDEVFDAMSGFDRVTTMGRGPDEDPKFFLACGASAQAASLLTLGRMEFAPPSGECPRFRLPPE